MPSAFLPLKYKYSSGHDIRGWANYFSAVVSKEVFSKIDDLL
ncbi:group II intron maturase-specific domain-containing protein [Dapis sp. BLCC M126]